MLEGSVAVWVVQIDILYLPIFSLLSYEFAVGNIDFDN